MHDPTTPRIPFPALLAALAAALAAAMVLAPLVGPADISLARVFDASIPAAENPDRVIFFDLRLPRILFGALAGAALAVAGAVFQALLRNDLATPYTLGVSGGASFGALAAMHLAGLGAVGVAVWTAPLAAFLGAAFAVAVILMLARRARVADRVTTLLLAGVTMNLIFAAGILVLQFRANPYEAYQMIRWMMGGLDVAGLGTPAGLAAPLAALFLALAAHARALNAMTLGDAAAVHLGFDAGRVRLACLASASAATALVVAFSGPVGFVGLIAPHAVRRFTGPDHRRLLPAAALAGAAFLVACDAVARLVGGPAEFPVGIVTAALGGPFFLWILFRPPSRG